MTQIPADLQIAYEKALDTFAGRLDLTGIDIGFKYRGGLATDELAVRFHVAEKLPLPSLDENLVFPTAVDDTITDVIAARYVPQAATIPLRQQRLDPVQPGSSVSHFKVVGGTFGAVVYDRTTGAACLLSNAHVLAGDANSERGDPIIQPSSLDSGRRPRDTVARLDRWKLDVDGDAAVATFERERAIRSDQLGSGATIREARSVELGDILEKSGRSTGVTRARVDGIGRYRVRYAVGRRAVDAFKLVRVDAADPDDEISTNGDSGALWYDPATQVGVGLHFAGDTSASAFVEEALACHLLRVLDALDVSLVPIL